MRGGTERGRALDELGREEEAAEAERRAEQRRREVEAELVGT